MNSADIIRKTRRKNRTRGFTLIELLAVIAVIAILCTIMFWMFGPLMENKERKQAQIELEALKLSINEYKRLRGSYPNCPKKLCNGGQALFLSLIGFHNERGNLQVDPPYQSVVHESLFTMPGDFDPADIPDRAKTSKFKFYPYIGKILKREIMFLDPWNRPYVYEFPREDGLQGFKLFSAGPDGLVSTDENGNKDSDLDNVE